MSKGRCGPLVAVPMAAGSKGAGETPAARRAETGQWAARGRGGGRADSTLGAGSWGLQRSVSPYPAVPLWRASVPIWGALPTSCGWPSHSGVWGSGQWSASSPRSGLRQDGAECPGEPCFNVASDSKFQISVWGKGPGTQPGRRGLCARRSGRPAAGPWGASPTSPSVPGRVCPAPT